MQAPSIALGRKKTVEAYTMQETGDLLRRLCIQYNSDVADYDDWEIGEFYKLVRDLPYLEDPSNEEFCQRPAFTLSKEAYCRDCDDKAITMGAWLYRHDVPFRFVACSYKQKDDIHHCVIQLGKCWIGKDEKHLTDGTGVILDATYPNEDEFPPKKKYYNIYPLTEYLVRGGRD